MAEQKVFELKHLSGFKFRFAKLLTRELVALQTQLNFNDFEKASFTVCYILEHTEVEVKGTWTPVKVKDMEVYCPVDMENNAKAQNELTTMFLNDIIKPLFLSSNE